MTARPVLTAIAVTSSWLTAANLFAASVEARFRGKNAVSPRVIVNEFSPWESDNYPNLIYAIDLDAVGANGNRLFCDKQEEKPDGKVECRLKGEISTYQYLGSLKNSIYVFQVSSSSETGTYVNVTYRFFRIREESVSNVKGEKEKHSILTLVRDFPIEHKASTQHHFTKDKKAIEIRMRTFQEGKESKVVLRFD